MLDFDRPASIAAVFAETAPWLVINAAAYTAVDAAEDDADAAFRANRDGPAELARLCEAAGIPLIHVSTDYVFDGLQGRAVRRDRSDRAAGRLWREQACRRTGGAGRLFARDRAADLVGLFADRQEFRSHHVERRRSATDRLRVVADQKGCPTSAPDLAEAILAIAARIAAGGWQDRCAGHLPRRRHGLDDLARPGGCDIRGGGAARRAGPDGRSDHDRRMADAGDSGRPIRGWTAAGSKRCSGCACRRGATAWRARSMRSSPRREAGGSWRQG